ncbi:hypothetical protein J6590_095261 [Homalodisca vitripennis]|nr:hypothetical protein J6590_095261 [Homalodisca vitripennis]
MPRVKSSYAKPRKGVGGRKRKPASPNPNEMSKDESTPRPEMSTQSQSSSSKKINIDKYEMFNCDENYDNEIINMQILTFFENNVNESINNVIWSRVPKKDFVTLNTLEFGAYDAISTFNDGNIAKCKMLRAVGIEPCKRTIDAMKSFDYERVRRANCAISDFQRQARRQTRNLKRRIEEDFEEEPAYDPGMH